MLVGPPREAHRMTNKEPGHLRIELPGFNVLNCKHLRDIIFQLPQVRKRQSHIQLRKRLVQPCIEVVDREFRIALAWTQFLLGNSAQTVINAGKDGRSYGYSLSLHQEPGHDECFRANDVAAVVRKDKAAQPESQECG